MKKPFYSDKYQHLYHEVDFSTLDKSNTKYSEILVNPLYEQYDQEILESKDQLIVSLKSLIDKSCTQPQKNVLDLYFQGYTQQEIAKKLNVHQTTIQKTLYGNQIKVKNNKVFIGGIVSKLTKLSKEDKEIQSIINRIDYLQEIPIKNEIIKNNVINNVVKIQEYKQQINKISIVQETKICSKCRKNKPLTKKFYYKDKRDNTFRSRCKYCMQDYNTKLKQQYKENKKPESNFNLLLNEYNSNKQKVLDAQILIDSLTLSNKEIISKLTQIKQDYISTLNQDILNFND